MDRQPIYFARWATLLKKTKRQYQGHLAKFNTFNSVVKEKMSEKIFADNIKKGMTANNAKPTVTAIDGRFENEVVGGNWTEPSIRKYHEEFIKLKNNVEVWEQRIDSIDIVVKAFEQRKDMLISLGALVRSMIDNKLFIYKDKKKVKDGNEF